MFLYSFFSLAEKYWIILNGNFFESHELVDRDNERRCLWVVTNKQSWLVNRSYLFIFRDYIKVLTSLKWVVIFLLVIQFHLLRSYIQFEFSFPSITKWHGLSILTLTWSSFYDFGSIRTSITRLLIISNDKNKRTINI